MAYSSLDSTTGAPEFADADAPDPAVNPTQVAAFAAQVGTRLIGTTADRTAYAYAREGLRWWDTDTDSEYLHNGSGWLRVSKPRTTFTPGWSNFTVGASSVVAWYQIDGNICEGMVKVTVGAGFSMNSSNITVNLPVTGANNAEADDIGTAIFLDNGSGYYRGRLMMSSGSTMRLMHEPNGGTLGDVTVSAPFGWAVGDRISLFFRYEVGS